MTRFDSYKEIPARQRNVNKSSICIKNQSPINDSMSKVDQCCKGTSRVPVIDLDDSSDFNDDMSEITVIDLSKDDGYSSIGACSSSDSQKDEKAHNEIIENIDAAERMDSPRP